MANITAADIVKALGGDQRSGMCRCPAHDDNSPSLNVKDGNGGGVLVHCFAGCSQLDVIEALKVRGLWPSAGREQRFKMSKDDDTAERMRPLRADLNKDERDTFIDEAMSILRACGEEKATPSTYLKGRGLSITPPNARVLSAQDAAHLIGRRFPALVFPITDERHFLIGAHLTLLTADAAANAQNKDGTTFRRIYGQAKGGFVRLGRINPDAPLIIGEGVETVLAAMEISGLEGGIAALSANNMQHITPPPCSEVIVAADNDEPGREASEALADRLARGRCVRVALPPERFNDWNDVLRDPVLDLKAERETILRAPRHRPKETVGSVGMSSFMHMTFPKREYLLRPWLTTAGLSMLFADPGAGKTRLALSISYSVASGQPLLGWQCERPAPALYVDGEMPGELLQGWLNNLGPTLPDENFQILSHAALETHNQSMPDLGEQAGRDYLDKIVERTGCGLIVLDSVSTLVRVGVENDVESWRAIQDWAIKHRLRGRAVLFLHHTGRSGKMRGTSMREVTLDTAIRLTGLPEESTDSSTSVELSFPKARHFFGKDAAPKIVRFSTTTGLIEWTATAKKPTLPHAEAVKDMLDRGMRQTEIAKKLGVSPARITQIVKSLRVGAQEEDAKS